MAAFVSSSSTSTRPAYTHLLNPKFKHPSFSTLALFPNSSLSLNPRKISCKKLICCFAAKQQQAGPVKKRQSSSQKTAKKNRGRTGGSGSGFKKGFGANEEKDDNDNDNDNDFDDGEVEVGMLSGSSGYQPLPLPKPPAGFVVDDQGKVVTVSNKRIATIVDPENNCPLECVIRRVFRTTQGVECMLLCPADMPVQVVKSVNFEGWTEVNDEELEAILPAVAYALAKVHMHLVYSGFCYTARGGFCYTEADLFEYRTDDGQDADGAPTEGIEITCFQQDGSHYMLYTPADPLLFVAVKDGNGQLQIAGDEVLDDPAITSAVDEEIEFNALVEEEAALLESLLGMR